MKEPPLRFILSVFESAGLCSTPSFARRAETVLALVEKKLHDWELKVTSWEPIEQLTCFAVLIYAQSQAGGRLNLLELRRELAAALAQHELQLRIQREDVFLAMHRL
jgi:predicted amino acid-binding ACT domain protein